MTTEARPPDLLWRGDDGPTPLNPPAVHVAKDSPVIHILGSLQELSAALGLVRSWLPGEDLADLDDLLRSAQRDLYVVKADFAAASDEAVVEGKRIPRPSPEMLAAINGHVDKLEARLGSKPDRFVLEGGAPAAAALYLANEVARRAERLCVGLKGSPGVTGTRLQEKVVFCQQYLNHLSYQLYLMARVTNRSLGIAEESIVTDAATGEVTVASEADHQPP